MKKRGYAFRILAVVLMLSLMLPMVAFAETKEFVADEEYFGLTGSLVFSNFKEEISDLVTAEVNVKSVNSENEDDYYERIQIISDALVVGNPSTIEFKVDEPTNAEIKVYKVTKVDDVYVYFYDQELPVSSGQIDKAEDPDAGDSDVYYPGVTFELNEAGEYYIELYLFGEASVIGHSLLVQVIDEAEEAVTEEEPAEEVEEVEEEVVEEVTEEVEEVVVKTAKPTPSKVFVDGVETSFDAYLIDGNNYFKLRDLAEVVKGTEKQFEVVWDAENKVIRLISNEEYTSEGEELTTGDSEDKEAKLNKSKLFIDEAEVELEAYTIEGYNYFKLRDIAQAFDIGVTYNEETREIGIDTTTGYLE